MQILDHRDFAKFDTSSVKSVSYGGAPAPPELVRRIQAAFPGGQPGNGYGLTETSAAVCLNSGADYLAKPDSCGPAMPVVELAIVPEDFDGDEPSADLPRGPGVVGELWIKGPNVVRGYWNKPEATAKAFTKGWLRSGDIARIDEEGFVFIVDRAKDMIIRGGENVYSVIVEAAIFEHPDVADCAVVGLPHTTMGEEVAAVIVLRPDTCSRPKRSIATWPVTWRASKCRPGSSFGPSHSRAIRRAKCSSANFGPRSSKRSSVRPSREVRRARRRSRRRA